MHWEEKYADHTPMNSMGTSRLKTLLNRAASLLSLRLEDL